MKRAFPWLAFIVPSLVRCIPELLMGGYLVGFDLMGSYLPTVITWQGNAMPIPGYIAEAPRLADAPLVYIILMALTSLGAPITATLKVLPSILHGILAATMYQYSCRVLDWSERKSLCAALLGTLYFVALRVSWDLLRNQLALSLVFVTLILLHRAANEAKHYLLLAVTMLLVAFTHQLTPGVMLGIMAVVILRDRGPTARRVAAAATPATLLFLYMASVRFSAGPGDPGWLNLFSSYPLMAVTMLAVLVYCFWPIGYPAYQGFRRSDNLPLKAWTGICLALAFIPVIGIEYRWILLLTSPLTIFAVDGLARLRSAWRTTKLMLVALVVAVLSGAFLILPISPYYQVWPRYIPASMLQNTIALADCPDTVDALHWLETNLDDSALVVAHVAFYGWALQVLDATQIRYYGWGSPSEAAEAAIQLGYARVYAIWWVRGYGWTPAMPEPFQMVYHSNRIAVYQHT